LRVGRAGAHGGGRCGVGAARLCGVASRAGPDTAPVIAPHPSRRIRPTVPITTPTWSPSARRAGGTPPARASTHHRKGDSMSNDDDQDVGIYRVVLNHE